MKVTMQESMAEAWRHDQGGCAEGISATLVQGCPRFQGICVRAMAGAQTGRSNKEDSVCDLVTIRAMSVKFPSQ